MSQQFDEPTPAELHQMATEYVRFSESKTSREFARRAFIIGVALKRYAEAMENGRE